MKSYTMQFMSGSAWAHQGIIISGYKWSKSVIESYFAQIKRSSTRLQFTNDPAVLLSNAKKLHNNMQMYLRFLKGCFCFAPFVR